MSMDFEREQGRQMAHAARVSWCHYLRYKAEFNLNIVVKAEFDSGLFSTKFKYQSFSGSKISPTLLLGRQVKMKEPPDKIKLTS